MEKEEFILYAVLEITRSNSSKPMDETIFQKIIRGLGWVRDTLTTVLQRFPHSVTLI